MALHRLFPTRIYEEPLKVSGQASLMERLLQECYQLRDVDAAGRAWSKRHYPGGYTSYGSLDELFRTSSNFENLKRGLDRHVARFAKELEYDLRGKTLEMSTLWVNIVPKHTYHGLHLHPLATISGTFYLQVPPKSGAIQFEDPRLASFMAAPPRKASSRAENQPFFRIQPKPGQVVLFESWLRHEVLQNQDTEDRVSISFNYHWT